MKRSVRVLLLGESDVSLEYLREFLEKRGCECSFAKTPGECVGTYGPCCFDLILDTLPTYAHPSISGLGTSSCSVFRSYRVENSCWWLPVVSDGTECFGAPALRPREFAGALEQALSKSESSKAVAAAA